MRIKLNEAKGKVLRGEPIGYFYKAIDAGDVEASKRYGMVILERSKGLCPESDSIRVDADGIMAEMDAAESIDDVNDCLNDMYDFFDDYSIAIVDGGDADVETAARKKVDVEEIPQGE